MGISFSTTAARRRAPTHPYPTPLHSHAPPDYPPYAAPPSPFPAHPPSVYHSYYNSNAYNVCNHAVPFVGQHYFGPFELHPSAPPPSGDHKPAKVVNSDINVHKDTLRLDTDDLNPDRFLVSFVFDALLDGRNLDMDYVDLYLIHWPVSAKHGEVEYPIRAEDFFPMEFGSVWAAIEECQRMRLTRAIGVSNFSSKKLMEILARARIPPIVNQVEVNPCWQQKELIKFCKEKGIVVVAYAPIGAFKTFYGTDRVMGSEVLKQIAEAKGKTIAQVALRWAFEHEIGVVMKSFNRERMRENMEIFDWSLSSEETDMIIEIPQERACLGKDYTSIYGPYKTIHQLWDEEEEEI